MTSGQHEDQRWLNIEIICAKNATTVWEGKVEVRVNKTK